MGNRFIGNFVYFFVSATFLVEESSSVRRCQMAYEPTDYSVAQLPSEAVVVNATYFVKQLHQVNEVEQALGLRILLELRWTDPRLSGLLPEGCATAVIRGKDGVMPPPIWTPDFWMRNVKEDVRRSLLSAGEFELGGANGEIRAWCVLAVSVSCPMDFGRFPADSHACPVHMGSRSFDAEQVRFNTELVVQDSGHMSTLPFIVKVYSIKQLNLFAIVDRTISSSPV